jgi:hypothetical protein
MRTSMGTMAALACLLTGCCLKGPCPEPRLRLPQASQVEHIDVIRWQANGNFDSNFKITDRQKIEEILTELEAFNSDFYPPPDYGQTPSEVSIAFEDRKGLKAMVWIGPGWLGGVDHRQDKYGEFADRYRSLAPNDHQALLALLTR